MLQLPKLISKTKIMLGYQCSKNLYWALHKKNLIPPITPELQALFDQGNAVTVEARKRYQNGVLVDNPAFDFVGSLKKTRELLAAQTEHIFEAAFEYKGCYARADIISHNPLTQRWSVIEVKSSTKVKDEHLDDVGLQVWIMANSGLPIEKISILHLNNLCKYPDLDNLFIEEDVTDKLREKHTQISPRLNELFKAIRSDEEPLVDIGEHCFKPRECQFKEYCWEQKKMPSPNIFDLPAFYDKRWSMYNQGYVDVQALPTELLTEKEQICLKVLKTNKRFVDTKKIAEELSHWKFPLVFLDFETINPAIPVFNGTTPFMQIPFQFSVHILKDLESPPEHFEFLYDAVGDPRSALIPQLVKACQGEGSVVAYYSKFESNCLQDLAEFSPEFSEKLLQINSRLVDPLPIIKESVYDAQFKASYSIKSVGPALLGSNFGYEHMMVGEGGAAQRAYIEMAQLNSENARKMILKQALLDYCKQDTLVMLELVKWLYHNAKS